MMQSGQNKILSEDERKSMIYNAKRAYGEFLTALGYNWEFDPNMEETPFRVAKMMVNEITKGSYSEPPKIKVFDNVEKYPGLIFSGNIKVHSICSHHMMPFLGKSFISYIPGPTGKLLGLSKLNRIVKWYSQRPQLQEQLTMQIHNHINELVGENLGVAVVIKATHLCVKMRGVEDSSKMETSQLSGIFFSNENGARDEFYRMISNCKK